MAKAEQPSRLVKYWLTGKIDEALMLVSGDPGDPELLTEIGEMLLKDEPMPKVLKVNWEIVIDNIEAPVTFRLDHNRPYVG